MNGSSDQLGRLQPLDSSVGTWSTTRRRFLSLTALTLGGAVFGVSAAGCGTAQTGGSQEGSKGRPGAAGETMFQAGFERQAPKSLNPLDASTNWPTNWDKSQLI